MQVSNRASRLEWTYQLFEQLLAEPTRNGIHKGPSFQGRGVPIVKMGEVYSNHVIRHGARDLLQLTPREIEKLHVRRGDLLFCRTSLVAEGVGRCAIVDTLIEPTAFASNLIRARLDENKAVPQFYHYYFSSPDGISQLLSIARGTSVTTITGPDIAALQVPVPSLAEQRAIAAILGALDDKIELNRRMNETLEALVHALFQSWFVDFDPVRAKLEGRQPVGMDTETAALFPNKFEDAAEGEIPQGWRTGALGEVTVNPRRGVEPSEVEPDTPYIGLEHMPRGSIALVEWGRAGDVTSMKLAFHRGEILFGKLRPYFRKVGVAPVDGVASSDIIVIAAEPQWFGFVLGHASSGAFIDYANAASTGTRMPRASWSHMAQYEVVLPPPDVALAFTTLVRPLVERIEAGIMESRTLAAVRDALLPKPVSGEVRVREAEQLMGSHV